MKRRMVFSFGVEWRNDMLFDFGFRTFYCRSFRLGKDFIQRLSITHFRFNIAIRMWIWLAGQLHGFWTPGPFTFCFMLFFFLFRLFPGNLSPMVNGCSNVFHAAFITILTIFMWVWCSVCVPQQIYCPSMQRINLWSMLTTRFSIDIYMKNNPNTHFVYYAIPCNWAWCVLLACVFIHTVIWLR